MKPCFVPTNILLPSDKTDMAKWSVIACDQYTSKPEYWEKVSAEIGGAPSTLKLVYPEVWLSEGQSRTDEICAEMKEYLEKGIVAEQVRDGFVLVVRETRHGTRVGIVGAVDLEQYDYTPDSKTAIRASEGTVISRIPPRVKIRENAALELPHVMLLLDDEKKQLIEPLYEKRETLPVLYDFELCADGGHIAGYAVDGELAKEIAAKAAEMQTVSPSLFIIVGDGNHSLATAKTCWENLKKQGAADDNPARWSLAELVNLHSEAMNFEPIHRVLFGADLNDCAKSFGEYLGQKGMSLADGNEIVFEAAGVKKSFEIKGRGDLLPVMLIQDWIDGYMADKKEISVDYVHGAEDVDELSAKGGNVGILLPAMDKNSLFPAIEAGGVLPRKTFSIGEADEKRFYTEARLIK